MKLLGSKREQDTEREMSLIGHLGELRYRLIVMVVAVVLCTTFSFFLAKPALSLLTSPIKRVGPSAEELHDRMLSFELTEDGTLKLLSPQEALSSTDLITESFRLVLPASDAEKKPQEIIIGKQPEQKFYYSSPLDPFMLQLKISLILGLIIALPICLHQLWRFIAPGLTQPERKVIGPMLSFAVILFPIGASFAFFVTGLVLVVMQHYQVNNVDPLLDIFKYISLMMTMMFAFGVIFEMPLAMAIAARLGLISPQMLSRYRRHIWLALAFVSMILTPADPFSMLLAFFPLVALFEISVILVKPMYRQFDEGIKSDDESASTEA